MSAVALSPRAVRSSGVPRLHSASRWRVMAARGLDAVTGQPASFARASVSSALDSRGATVSVGYGLPRREARECPNAAGEMVPVLGVRYTGDDCTWPLEWMPESGTLYVSGINLGTAQTAGAGLLYVGRDDNTGARLLVHGDGTTFRALWHTGTDDSEAILPLAVPNAARFALVAQLEDDGTSQRVRVRGMVNGQFSDWSPWGDAVARAAAFGAGAKLRVNRVGSAGTQGDFWLREAAWDAGHYDLHEMEARL